MSAPDGTTGVERQPNQSKLFRPWFLPGAFAPRLRVRANGGEVLFKNEATAVEDSTVGKLAEFFPEATPVSVPVRLRATDAAGNPFSQETQIEFCTSREVLFAAAVPLEFQERILLESACGSFTADASVAAMRCDNRRRAVAARLARRVPNWILPQ